MASAVHAVFGTSLRQPKAILKDVDVKLYGKTFRPMMDLCPVISKYTINKAINDNDLVIVKPHPVVMAREDENLVISYWVDCDRYKQVSPSAFLFQPPRPSISVRVEHMASEFSIYRLGGVTFGDVCEEFEKRKLWNPRSKVRVAMNKERRRKLSALDCSLKYTLDEIDREMCKERVDYDRGSGDRLLTNKEWNKKKTKARTFYRLKRKEAKRNNMRISALGAVYEDSECVQEAEKALIREKEQNGKDPGTKLRESQRGNYPVQRVSQLRENWSGLLQGVEMVA